MTRCRPVSIAVASFGQFTALTAPAPAFFLLLLLLLGDSEQKSKSRSRSKSKSRREPLQIAIRISALLTTKHRRHRVPRKALRGLPSARIQFLAVVLSLWARDASVESL